MKTEQEINEMVEKIAKCKMCKDYDDTWTFECFCNECQEELKKEVIL